MITPGPFDFLRGEDRISKKTTKQKTMMMMMKDQLESLAMLKVKMCPVEDQAVQVRCRNPCCDM